MTIWQPLNADAGIPEWGDPYEYPAGYDGFVSFHPPGSEGWPYDNLAYLRPWPPPGATSSSGPYSTAAWPLCNGSHGDTSPRHRRTAYPLRNQPVYHTNGASRPGPMTRVVPGVHVPKHLVTPSISDEFGFGFVELNTNLQYQREDDRSPLIDVTQSEIKYLSDYSPESLSSLTTVPPCKWMELEHPRYPWKITVTAQVPAQGFLAGVTIEDVFIAIFEDLRKPVTSVEAYSVLGTSDALRRHEAATMRADGRVGGFSRLKRLHWLGTRSAHFLGISPDKHDPARWRMHFSHDDLPERPLPPLPLDDDPPEYELNSSSPSFIILEQGGVYRAVRVEPCRHHATEALQIPRNEKHHRRRSRSRHLVNSS